RNRRAISNAFQRSAVHDQRQAILLRIEARAHLRERGNDPVHRPLAERLVASEARTQFIGGGRPDEEPRAGAGITAIDSLARLAEPAGAGDHPGAVVPPFDARAELAHRLSRMANVVALQQARDSGFAFREGAHDERPVGDGLIPRRAGSACERSGKSRLQTHGGNSCPEAKKPGRDKAFDRRVRWWQASAPHGVATPREPMESRLGKTDL